jgi:RNase P subunit RPR2
MADPDPGVAYDKTLTRVVEILSAVRQTLNITSTTCDECGVVARMDYNQYQAHEALLAAISRIDKAKRLIQISLEEELDDN